MRLKVKRLSEAAVVPAYAHEGDAGLDLFAAEGVVLQPGRSVLVKTGIAVQLPEGTEGQVRPRSGLALSSCVTVLNSPGTIDAGYRGEIGVILINHGATPFMVDVGMKIAQLIVAPQLVVEVLEVDQLDESARDNRGFGSTGSRKRKLVDPP
jgi:dUTP diphosphatase